MKRFCFFMMIATMLIGVLPTSLGNPVQVYTEPDPRQDTWTLQGWVDELGVGFPPAENIFAQQIPWEGHIPCPTDWQGQTPVQIEIINLTGKEWPELYYVADEQTFLSNVDEMVGDMSVPGTAPAFKIDAVGLNTPLVLQQA